MFLLPRILCTFKEFKSDDQIVLTRLEVKVFSRRLSAFFQVVIFDIDFFEKISNFLFVFSGLFDQCCASSFIINKGRSFFCCNTDFEFKFQRKENQRRFYIPVIIFCAVI